MNKMNNEKERKGKERKKKMNTLIYDRDIRCDRESTPIHPAPLSYPSTPEIRVRTRRGKRRGRGLEGEGERVEEEGRRRE